MEAKSHDAHKNKLYDRITELESELDRAKHHNTWSQNRIQELEAALELAKTALETCREYLGKEDIESQELEELQGEWITHPLNVIEQALKGE